LYSQHKHLEWERFHQTVTEWDQKEYMKFF
ncbi:MAG: hypothetical protein QOD73_44, partial [Solirubrobacteraceae bacterium]|nr:hypothetical protein [Solirubrobacteraceae bacterium]